MFKIGRVIRLQQADVDSFTERSRGEPESLKHLSPETRTDEGQPMMMMMMNSRTSVPAVQGSLL